MSKSEQLPYLDIVPYVKPHHGHTFIEELTALLRESGALAEAFAETHLIEWPDGDAPIGTTTPAHERYDAIVDEIIDRLLDESRPQIEEAFVRIADEVLGREKERQRNAAK